MRQCRWDNRRICTYFRWPLDCTIWLENGLLHYCRAQRHFSLHIATKIPAKFQSRDVFIQ